MTVLVEQRGKSDCAIAAVAMATGRSYEDVLEAAGACYDPASGTRDVGQVLRNLGLEQENRFPKPEGAGDFRSLHLPWGIHPDLLRAWLWGRPALISVPSLNIEGGSHMIYYDGLDLHDPNPPSRKRYTSFDDVAPKEAWVFREVKL